MHFLQNSPIQIHGNLKSSNVLIDSRWTCKVTDHGFFLFNEGQEIDVEAGTDAKYYGTFTSIKCFDTWGGETNKEIQPTSNDKIKHEPNEGEKKYSKAKTETRRHKVREENITR